MFFNAYKMDRILEEMTGNGRFYVHLNQADGHEAKSSKKLRSGLMILKPPGRCTHVIIAEVTDG